MHFLSEVIHLSKNFFPDLLHFSCANGAELLLAANRSTFLAFSGTPILASFFLFTITLGHVLDKPHSASFVHHLQHLSIIVIPLFDRFTAYAEFSLSLSFIFYFLRAL